jgi:hypothetical protein
VGRRDVLALVAQRDTLKRHYALALALIALGTPARADEPPVYRNTLLGISATAVTLEGGATLRRSPTLGARDFTRALGHTVYLQIDENGTVTTLALAQPRHTQLVPFTDLPQATFAIAARSTAQQAADRIALRIVVAVPPRTPSGDDVYLSTDRTGFAAAELRMNRIDPLHWAIDVPIARGSTLIYRFTRGSSANGERDAAGGGVRAHTVLADAPKSTHDTVASWADVP